MHNNDQHLLNIINQASTLVKIGGIYYHYKDKQRENPYLVKAIALKEENEEPTVIYQAQYGHNLTWERSVASWIEIVDNQFPRFVQIETENNAY